MVFPSLWQTGMFRFNLHIFWGQETYNDFPFTLLLPSTFCLPLVVQGLARWLNRHLLGAHNVIFPLLGASSLIVGEKRIASLRSPPVPQSLFSLLRSALYQHSGCRKTWVGEKDRVNVFFFFFLLTYCLSTGPVKRYLVLWPKNVCHLIHHLSITDKVGLPTWHHPFLL